MFVDPAMLRSGAAGAADVFHNALSTAYTEQITTLTDHRRTLAEVGDKAHHAAREFTGMDQHNAAQLRVVRCNSST